MNKYWKDQWVKALRSGEYKQGQHRLCREVDSECQYCVLGVLCDISYNGYWEKFQDVWRVGGRSGFPVEELLEEVGLTPNDASFLAGRNDSGLDFRMLANYIEEWL